MFSMLLHYTVTIEAAFHILEVSSASTLVHRLKYMTRKGNDRQSI